MPPIMGAAAFIMATYTETPYSQIMLGPDTGCSLFQRCLPRRAFRV